MRLKSVAVKNFRCYAQEVSVEFDELTTFVGRKDTGKSTIPEALVFYNRVVSIEKGDTCIHSGQDNVEITCEFIGLLPPSRSTPARKLPFRKRFCRRETAH